MKLNEKLAQILEIAEDDRRQESIARAEKHKPKYIDKLVYQAKKGRPDGIVIEDADDIYLGHLRHFFEDEGFVVSPDNNGVHIGIVRPGRSSKK